MRKKEFEKFITNVFLEDKNVKKVYVGEVKKDIIKKNLYLQQHEDILYIWDFYKGNVIVNYCKK